MEWKPTARQAQFLSLPDTIFEALYGGQAGGGKTDVLLMLPLVRGFYKEARFKGLLLRRTSPELEREMIVRSQGLGFYKACGGTYNGQHKRWTFDSGAIIQFGHFEYEKDAKIYDSAEYNYIGFDEVTSFTPYQYEYLVYSRCRSSADNLPAIIRSGTNPGGVSHNYFRSRFVEPARNGGVVINEIRTVEGRETKVKIIFIRSKATDNEHLMKSDPGYLDRMQRLPEAERIAKAEGDWWIYSGQVFDDFRAEKLLSEPENALHVIKPFPIPWFWPKILSIDWGYDAMTHALWWAINPLPDEKYPGKLYIFREYAAKKEKISTWAGNLKALSLGEDLRDVVLDPSAFGHRGDEKTIAEQFEISFGRASRRADNERISGKLLVQEYLKWKYTPRQLPTSGFDSNVALQIRRLQGEAGLKAYEQSFLIQEDEGYLPKLQIFDNCKELIKCIPLCIYSKNNPEDVEEFKGDDPYDNLRYGLKACQNFLTSNIAESMREAERTSLLNKLEETKNMTNFYMNMERLDSKERLANKPIRRIGLRRRSHVR